MRLIDRIIENIGNAMSSIYGWLLIVGTSFLTFIQPEQWSFVVVGAAILADLVWGVAAALKMKCFLLSKALRETVKKIGIYAFALLGVLAIEKILHVDGAFLSVKLISILAAVCELWSMSANMLIIKPDMPFLKLFRGQLKGEISAKVSRNVDVDEIFKDKEKKHETDEAKN